MLKIKFKRLYENVALPYQSSEEASCFDVVANEVIVVGNTATIKLGFSTEIPKGYKGIIVPRSSFTQKGWIMQNSPAQIDSDYRGEWIIKFEAISKYPSWLKTIIDNFLNNEDFPYKEGERCAQIYFEKIIKVNFEETDDLKNTSRGEGGFGSTGK